MIVMFEQAPGAEKTFRILATDGAHAPPSWEYLAEDFAHCTPEPGEKALADLAVDESAVLDQGCGRCSYVVQRVA